jgi:hypothetical protein
VVLLALTVGLFSLDCWRNLSKERAFGDSTAFPALRAVTIFVVSVGVFDLLLFVGGVAVVDFCRLALRLM